MFVQQGRETGHVTELRGSFCGLVLFQGLLQIPGILQYQGADGQTNSAKPVLHALAVALAQFAFLAVEDGPSHGVPPLAPVELHQDAPAIGLVLHVSQQV